MKQQHIIIAGTVLAIVSILYFGIIKKQEPTRRNKQENVFLIISHGKHTDSDAISKFENAFIESWANATENKQDYFVYNGIQYNTQGGKRRT